MMLSPLSVVPFVFMFGCAKSTDSAAQRATSPAASALVPHTAADAATAPDPGAADTKVGTIAVSDAAAADAHAQRCEVRVGKLTAANKYMGNRLTPADSARLNRDPAQARFENGTSHGAQHIECTFDVTVNRF